MKQGWNWLFLYCFR